MGGFGPDVTHAHQRVAPVLQTLVHQLLLVIKRGENVAVAAAVVIVYEKA